VGQLPGNRSSVESKSNGKSNNGISQVVFEKYQASGDKKQGAPVVQKEYAGRDYLGASGTSGASPRESAEHSYQQMPGAYNTSQRDISKKAPEAEHRPGTQGIKARPKYDEMRNEKARMSHLAHEEHS